MESRENQVSVKSAVKAAIDYVKDLYADSNLRDLMLEEVEFSEATNQWLVTVGFSLTETKEESTSLITPSKTSRALSRRYKVVNIDAETGEPVSMKIRAI
jgi:hypothetical protein